MATTYIAYNGPLVMPRIVFTYIAQPRIGSASASPIPVAANLAGGIVGAAYSETISAQGGISPYTYSLLSGTLPTGTTLNSSTGVISGTPTVASTYSFTIKATDSTGNFGSYAFQIIVATPSVGTAPLIWVG